MGKIFIHDKLNPSGGVTFEIEIAGPYILYVNRFSMTTRYICVLAKKGLFGRSPLFNFELYGYLPYVMTQGVNNSFDFLDQKPFLEKNIRLIHK